MSLFMWNWQTERINKHFSNWKFYVLISEKTRWLLFVVASHRSDVFDPHSHKIDENCGGTNCVSQECAVLTLLQIEMILLPIKYRLSSHFSRISIVWVLWVWTINKNWVDFVANCNMLKTSLQLNHTQKVKTPIGKMKYFYKKMFEMQIKIAESEAQPFPTTWILLSTL